MNWYNRDVEINKEKNNNSSRKYRLENPEKRKASVHLWERANPDKVKANNNKKNHVRRSKVKELGVYTRQEWDSLLETYNHCCLCCGSSSVKLTIDHIVPISIGGPNTIDNLQPLCGPCNSRKGTKVIDYRVPTSKEEDLAMP